MPASTVSELFDYETNIEDAFASSFAAAFPSWQVLTSRTTQAEEEAMQTPRLEIEMSITGTLPHEITRAGGQVYSDGKTGTLKFTTAVRRNETGQSLGTMRGAIRAAMLKESTVLNSTTLPFYQVIRLSEISSSPKINGENDEIICELSYSIEFAVLPSQWPV